MIKDFPESMTANDSVDLEIAEKFAWYLKEYCDEKTDEFSLEGLRQRIDQIPKTFIQDVLQEKLFVQDVLREASMLCGSKNVSIYMIRCLLEYFPEGISSKFDTAYPLHFACNNEHCPHDVIQLLVEACPGALRVSSAFEGGFIATGSTYDDEEDNEVSGLPLHYYVSRSSPKINEGTILMLVNHYPESMTKACEDSYTGVAPIDILMETNAFGFSELIKYCETGSLTVDAIRKRMNRIPKELFFSEVCNLPEHLNLLQLVCSNENVTLEVVEYLLAEYDPDGVGREIDVNYPHESLTAYPLHWACMNSSCPDSVIQLLVTRYPTALRKVSVLGSGIGVDHPIPRELVQDEGSLAGLPLHYYLGRVKNIDIDTVKMMVKQYPESLTIAGRDHALYYSAVYAPLHIMLMNQLQVMNSFEIVKFLIESNETFLTNQLTGIGHLTLQIACRSFEMDPRIIKLIINTCPELICHADHDGDTAVHVLCRNRSLPDNMFVEILLLLIEKDPASLKIMNGHQGGWEERMLPIHVAAMVGRSKHTCKILYDADKESIRARTSRNRLPLHVAHVVILIQLNACLISIH